MNGQEVPYLSINNNEINAPYYNQQFIDYAIQFLKKLLCLVLMGENDPHNFQINLFLKKLIFPWNKKVSFKIGILEKNFNRRWLWKIGKKQCFNSKIKEVNNIERKSIDNNLVQIF